MHKLLFKYISKFLFLFAFTASSIFATGNTISGFVKDKETGETLVGASVYFMNTNYGARTNKSGFYSIVNIPDGEYTIQVTYLGYSTYKEKIKIKNNKSQRKNIELTPSKVEGEEITVIAEREYEKRQISISKVEVPVQQLKEIKIGGEADLFRALQYLPGILTSSQISSGLYIRGGSPDQNLILLDGSIVYNPTHVFGFFSTFNTDAVKDVELIKGGFNSEFGGRLSSVLQITQKDGNRNNYQGNASIGVISSRASVEGPIGRGSFFVGGRRTYLDLIKTFLKEDPESPIPDFGFYDLNVKITQNITENDIVSLSGFITSDKFDFGGSGIDFKMDVGNQLGAFKWTHVFGDNLFSNLNASYTRYASGFVGEQSDFYTSFQNSIEDYTILNNYEWFFNDRLSLKFGLQTTKREFDIEQNFSGEKDSTSASTDAAITNINIKDWNHSAYFQANYMPNDLTSVQLGLRADYWNLKEAFTYDPRIALRYQLFENFAVKFGWGIYHQNLKLLTDPNFSFFDTWLPSDSTVSISKSIHYIFSLETQLFKGYDFNFDVYYKTLDGISEMNRFALEGKTASDVFYIGKGYTYGFELFAQKKYGKFTGWAGYAYGYIISQFDQINKGNKFNPKYDRRNDLKIVLNYQINERWNISSSFVFQSGQPYTGATSRVRIDLPGQTYGFSKIVNSDLYGLRLPPSHQLNLNASYTFKMYNFPAIVSLDIYNVYSHRDIWFRYYRTVEDETTVEDVLLLPIIPSLSFEIQFK